MGIFDIFRSKKKLDAPWSKYYTKENLEVHLPDISMYEQVRLSYIKYPSNTAIQYMGRKFDYASVIEKIDTLANGFASMGIRKGDIITILLPNIPECLLCLYALNKLGAIANMTHPLSAQEEIKETLLSTNSKFLVIYDAQYSKIKSFIKEIDMKKVIFFSTSNSLVCVKSIVYDFSQRNKF